MFNATTFVSVNPTRSLKSELVAGAPMFKFGMVSLDGVPLADLKTIAFGHMVGGSKVRLGSVVIEEDRILILAMDGQHEYRASCTQEAIRFLLKLAYYGHDWGKADDAMPR